jgi:hypothetical protein
VEPLLIGNIVSKFINPKMLKRQFLRGRFMSTIPAEVSRFDAENATAMTADFLKRLGYKGNWLPMKVALDGEAATNSLFKSKGKIIFLVAAISIAVVIVKLLGVF